MIYGYPFQLLPPAKWQHNNVQGNLFYQAKAEIQNNNCNCYAFTELDWKINNDTVVRPDVMIVSDEIKTDYLEFPPVFIAEIISQSSLQKDRNIKFNRYQENGVKYYLMLDYIKETIETFQLIDSAYHSVETTQFILTDSCSIDFDFTNIFKM